MPTKGETRQYINWCSSGRVHGPGLVRQFSLSNPPSDRRETRKENAHSSPKDPIDTTSSKGRLVIDIYSSLAEFERDLIWERTQAGLHDAKARRRLGKVPNGFSNQVKRKTVANEMICREGTRDRAPP